MNDNTKNVLQKLYQAKKGINRPPYKRVFITGSPKEYHLRIFSTEMMDPKGLPFAKTWLHGGFHHPNYDSKYPSNFRCGGKGCPLCNHYRAQKEEEKELPKEKREAWKKRSSPYALYWGENVETGDLCLIHVSDSAPQGAESIQEKLFNALVEQLEKGVNPMDLDNGMNLQVKVRIVDSKVKLDISFDTKTSPIKDEHRKVLKDLAVLSTVYKEYSKEHLQCIADGERIEYGDNNQSAKNMKKALHEVNESEEHFEDESYDDSLSDGEELLQEDSFLDEDEFVMPDEEEGDDNFDDTLNNLLRSDDEE